MYICIARSLKREPTMLARLCASRVGLTERCVEILWIYLPLYLYNLNFPIIEVYIYSYYETHMYICIARSLKREPTMLARLCASRVGLTERCVEILWIYLPLYLYNLNFPIIEVYIYSYYETHMYMCIAHLLKREQKMLALSCASRADLTERCAGRI